MDFWVTDDQVALAEGMRAFVAGRFPTEWLHSVEETDAVLDRTKWRELGDMGVFSLRSDGMGAREATLVYEELGRGLVPGPLVATHLAAELIDGAADGTRIVSMFEPSGGVTMIEHATEIDDLLWFDGHDLRRIDPASLTLDPVRRPLDPLGPVLICLDGLDQVRSNSAVIATGTPVRELSELGVLLTAALQVGVAAAATDLANEYAKGREQFGRPIGSFQAVKHMLAEMFVHADVARAAVRAGGCALDDASDAEPARAVSGAKAVAGHAALFCGKTGIQIHGGMGFTWEVDAQRYWKRAVALDVSFGSTDDHSLAIADMLIRP